MFAFDGVWVEAGGSPILADVTVELPDVGIVAIEGPSGAGKSTLLRLCNRLAVPDRGQVAYRGRDLAAADPLDHRRRVGMVFQRPIVFDGTVLDNLRAADPTLAAGDAGAGRLLAAVGLDEALAERDAATLSGGEAQRLCMARALATGPEVLLLDEPTSSLDEESARVIEELALALAADGLHQVWVSHNKAQVARLARWRVRLDGGQVTSSQPAPATPTGGPADEGPAADPATTPSEGLAEGGGGGTSHVAS